MTQVNLLPTEVREGQKSRRALAAVILAVGAAVFLLLFIYTLQTARLSNANHKLVAQQAKLRELEMRLKLLESEMRGQIDLAQLGKPELLQGEE